MLPLYIEVSDKRIIVFGGGGVAERKICQILETGSEIPEKNPNLEVYSLKFTPRIKALCEAKKIHCVQCDLWNKNVEELIKGAFLILICTSDERLNARIFN
ncbi:MAG: hypothetical protein EFT35_06130 [Methanophagales archaeon ANME-1-THS]|nr:MAG: hypothetical protein EFT35_06130 [Methanophagales archaeon ANME-1-THS]